jgi:phospholipase C
MPEPNEASGDPIKHVVLLTLENHSFDQMLGCLKEIYPQLEGVDPANPRVNKDDRGRAFAQKPTRERQMLLDPHHEVEHVATQLADKNGGFVLDFARCFPGKSDEILGYIMGYYPLGFLPALHGLARDFTICDHWFASLPGPTWPNRFFALTGTSKGRVNMPDDGTHKADLPGYFQQDQDTIFDRLSDKGIHWKAYFHDIPQSWVLTHQRMPHNAARYYYIREFYADARGAEEEFPSFSFIEPDFMGVNENDDHPPHDIMKAEKLIADVYNALRANARLWNSTLLVVFYDEHGGFYDHVEPPDAVAPDGHCEEYKFNRLGVRVPALLVSPWVERRVLSTRFDHTSVLKYLIEKWQLEPLPSRRVEDAVSIGVAVTSPVARTDTIRSIDLTLEQLTPPDLDKEEEIFGIVNAHQTALQKLSAYLNVALWERTADKALPIWFAWVSRALEWAKVQLVYFLEGMRGLCESLLAYLYEEKGFSVSIAHPDKLTMKHASEQDSAAHFLMHQKPRAVRGLAKRIHDPNAAPAVREHALVTLAAMTGRKFHRHGIEHAREWLKKWGQSESGG